MQSKIMFSPELSKATGQIRYGMTNDYMFRALFQKNPKALKGLLSSLLHIPPDEIISVQILNPIQIGSSIQSKEFRLDIKLLLNNQQQIDLEMQIENYHDWPERSIGYLSRMYDNLNHGEDYISTKPALHIGILDYTPFPDEPLFYSQNLLMDVNTKRIYSSKFAINVLDLTKEHLATEDDKLWQLDYWSRLLKATDWEEIKMIAADNEYLTEASNTLCDLYEDFNVRERCRDREDYLYRMKYMQDTIEQQTADLQQKDATIQQQTADLQQKDAALEQKDATIQQQTTDLQQKDAALHQKDNEIQRLRDELARLQKK